MNAFYDELKKIAKASMERTALLIASPRADERSADLLDDVEPQLVADIFKSVAKQAQRDPSGDSFWPEMASEVVRNCAVVARAFDRLPEGRAWIEEFVERPYSIEFICQLALDDGPLMESVFEAILRASENPDAFYLIEDIYTTELTEAMTYLSRDWLPIAPGTRQGIMDQIALIMHSAHHPAAPSTPIKTA